VTAASLLAFAGLCVILAVAPGPDAFIVLRLSIGSGAAAGLAAASGAAAGSIAWAAATGVGLSALLANWATGYTVLRVLGALYLVYLGIQALLARPSDYRAATAKSTWQRAAGTGLLSALLNPKIGLFFLAVAPQFVPDTGALLPWTLLLGTIDAAVAITWLAVLAFGASRLVGWLSKPSVNRHLERTTGVALTGLGIVTVVNG
jgi:threonine/homoserine/homoserine lactone efflux protein